MASTGCWGLVTGDWKSLFPKGSERLAGSPLRREVGQFQLSLSTNQALSHLTEYAPTRAKYHGHLKDVIILIAQMRKPGL